MLLACCPENVLLACCPANGTLGDAVAAAAGCHEGAPLPAPGGSSCTGCHAGAASPCKGGTGAAGGGAADGAPSACHDGAAGAKACQAGPEGAAAASGTPVLCQNGVDASGDWPEGASDSPPNMSSGAILLAAGVPMPGLAAGFASPCVCVRPGAMPAPYDPAGGPAADATGAADGGRGR
jgi:hypothetical protein